MLDTVQDKPMSLLEYYSKILGEIFSFAQFKYDVGSKMTFLFSISPLLSSPANNPLKCIFIYLCSARLIYFEIRLTGIYEYLTPSTQLPLQ